jgi:proline racemase
LGAKLEVPGIGTLTVDTAHGGDSIVIVDAPSLGFRIVPDEARKLSEKGARITAAANEQIGFRHPTNSDWNRISFCQFAMPTERQEGILTERNAVAIDPEKTRSFSMWHRLFRQIGGAACKMRNADRQPVYRVFHYRVQI